MRGGGGNPQSGLPQWPFLSFYVSKVGVSVSVKRESSERKPQEGRLLGQRPKHKARYLI